MAHVLTFALTPALVLVNSALGIVMRRRRSRQRVHDAPTPAEATEEMMP